MTFPPVPPQPGDGQRPSYGAPPPGSPPPGSQIPPYTGTSTPGPGGYGGPQDTPPTWQQLPPEHLSRMSQPGVIPLRPLNLGDIFTGALQTMRRNPEATIGMGLLVMAVFMVPSLLISLGVTRLAEMAIEDQVTLSTGIQTIMQMFASTMLTGMIIFVVSEAVLGDRASLSQTWQATRGRIPALIGTILLIGLLIVVAVVVPIILFVVLLVAISESSGSVGAVVLLGILGFFALLLFTLWFSVRISLAPAPVVLEKLSPTKAIARSWRLTSGRQFWRILGITLLAGIITNIFSTMVQVPLMLLLEVGFGAMTGVPQAGVLIAGNHLIALLIDAVVIPFTAGVTALLYLDQRIRREGLDVGLVRAAQERAAARQG